MLIVESEHFSIALAVLAYIAFFTINLKKNLRRVADCRNYLRRFQTDVTLLIRLALCDHIKNNVDSSATPVALLKISFAAMAIATYIWELGLNLCFARFAKMCQDGDRSEFRAVWQ